MTDQRFTLICAVYALLVKDGEVLLQRRANTGYEDGKYSVPAGHLDGGETMRKALVREVLEETGVTVRESDLVHALTLHRWCGDHERVELFFAATVWGGVPMIAEPHKHDDLQWFSTTNLPDNTIPYIRAAIDAYADGVSYLEFGWQDVPR